MSQNTLQYLSDELRATIKQQDARLRKAVLTDKRVIITFLLLVLTTEPLPTISLVVKNVSSAILLLPPWYICFPSGAASREVIRGFKREHRFPSTLELLMVLIYLLSHPCLSKARVDVEYTMYMYLWSIKSKCRCLLKCLDVSTDSVLGLVAACCVLPNMCEMHGDGVDEEWMEGISASESTHTSTNSTTSQSETSAVYIRKAFVSYCANFLISTCIITLLFMCIVALDVMYNAQY